MRQSLAVLRSSCLNLPIPGILVMWLHIWLCLFFVFFEVGIQVTGDWPWTAGCKNLLFWSFCLCHSRVGITGVIIMQVSGVLGIGLRTACVLPTELHVSPKFLIFFFLSKKWLMGLWNHSVPFKQVLEVPCLVKLIHFWEWVSLYSSGWPQTQRICPLLPLELSGIKGVCHLSSETYYLPITVGFFSLGCMKVGRQSHYVYPRPAWTQYPFALATRLFKIV